MAGTIGVGLIGTGYMGKCHALAWASVGTVFAPALRPRLVHLAEREEGLAETRAAEFGFARASGDWRALVSDPEVEIVSITAPNAFHADMAVAALEAGKHVWCEKPMATSLADAARMRDAAKSSGRVAILGYNYIQNPAIRLARQLIAEGEIGAIAHFRLEMDEDFMADAAAPFGLKSEASSGHGALDDFAVHPLSLMSVLAALPARVLTQAAQPYATRPAAEGPRKVETDDIADTLFTLPSGTTGTLSVNRSAWGRKGRIAIQLYGTTGAILFDQERFNELSLFKASDDAATQGFRTILAGPAHAPYGRFIPAPGHGLGFNDLKTIEASELLSAIGGADAHVIDFERGYEIERTVDAMARSAKSGVWETP